jgi:hypothetical protein
MTIAISLLNLTPASIRCMPLQSIHLGLFSSLQGGTALGPVGDECGFLFTLSLQAREAGEFLCYPSQFIWSGLTGRTSCRQ